MFTSRAQVLSTLNALYDGQTSQHNSGFVCSVYLLLALDTLSKLNHRSSKMGKEGNHLQAARSREGSWLPQA